MNPEHGPNLMDIHRAFAETEHGQALAAQVRYDRYKPAGVSNERWVELLGADVNNLTHMPLTYGLTQDMIRQLDMHQPDILSSEEAETLKVAALIHDWAEAIVGDITYSDKTLADEEVEKAELEKMLVQLAGKEATNLNALMLSAANEVVFSPDSKLGFVFNTVERVGYMRTAIRASRHVLAGTAPDCDEGLRWLVVDVLGNHIPALIERCEILLPVNRYLESQADVIQSAVLIVNEATFLQYPEAQRQQKHEAFNRASVLLAAWRQSTGD